MKNIEEALKVWEALGNIPINDNDERLSEIFTHPSHPKIINVLSGKVTTCHKIGKEIVDML